MTELHTLVPALVVSATDHRRLTGMALSLVDKSPELADDLLGELDRATVVPAETVPTDVVRMGSTVVFKPDDGPERRVTLVYPVDADIAEGRISILTPVGVALIGLRPGQSISWTARDGRDHRLTVLSVEPPAEPA